MASNNVRVVCRVRPLNEREQQGGSRRLFGTVQDDSFCYGQVRYTFDSVFDESHDQSAVYSRVGADVVAGFLNSRNQTLFAYGQTGSGKTHTMEGDLGDAIVHGGIVPRIVNQLFCQRENVRYRVTYCELYLEKFRDLLNPINDKITLLNVGKKYASLLGATEQIVSGPDEMMNCLRLGKSNRTFGSTNINQQSSRSHSVLTVEVHEEDGLRKSCGKLCLVDLAGSERVGKTGATATCLEEAKYINTSLSALGNVVSALTKTNKKSHIPYRASKLTRLLQESLEGNSQTTVIICCSPASSNESETKSTLNFGRRAKTITSRITDELVTEKSAEEWKHEVDLLNKRIEELEERLKRSEDDKSNDSTKTDTITTCSCAESVQDKDRQLKEKDLQIERMSYELKKLSRREIRRQGLESCKLIKNNCEESPSLTDDMKLANIKYIKTREVLLEKTEESAKLLKKIIRQQKTDDHNKFDPAERAKILFEAVAWEKSGLKFDCENFKHLGYHNIKRKTEQLAWTAKRMEDLDTRIKNVQESYASYKQLQDSFLRRGNNLHVIPASIPSFLANSYKAVGNFVECMPIA